MRAVKIEKFGGPEVLQVQDVPEPEWVPGTYLIEVESAGVNFADTHAVEDSYLQKQELPMIPGTEVVGRIVKGGTPAVDSQLAPSTSHHRKVPRVS